MDLDAKIEDYIRAKEVYRVNPGQPDRWKYKKKYQDIEKELMPLLPDIYKYENGRGVFYLMKGKAVFPRDGKEYPWIAIYPEKSWEKIKWYYEK